jgi:acyl-CoA synthetase (AMP-forming)/AMP-acid ligase II
VESPLTPLDFARRTRRLHGGREAVADGDLRLSYEQFFDRCDRWSSALAGLGVRPGDRVATIAPNTHAQLESFYAVPQLGAVLVPINYRLAADDFVYIVNHSGSSVVCADRDYLDVLDGVRDQMPGVRHFVALEAAREGWLDYEAAIAAAGTGLERPEISELDLLTINYTSGTTARPKGVMITHRNAAMNTIGTLLHIPLGVGERYLWTLPMFHANGWTFPWTETAAAGTHVCLRKVEPAAVFRLIRDEQVRLLCAAHGADLAGQRAAAGARRGAARGAGRDGRGAAGRRHDRAARGRVRLGGLPDPRWGEAPHAFVVLGDGASASEDELIAFTRDRLAHFKAPHGISFVDELPKTATGKIQKFVLRQGAPNLARQ